MQSVVDSAASTLSAISLAVAPTILGKEHGVVWCVGTLNPFSNFESNQVKYRLCGRMARQEQEIKRNALEDIHN